MKEKLRIGILLNDYYIPSWEYRIIEDIKNSNYAKLVLVIKDSSKCIKSVKREKGIARSLINLLEKTDRLLFKRKSDYNSKKDASKYFNDISEINILPKNAIHGEPDNSDVFKEIGGFKLDIILKFGFHILDGDFLRIPKYGVWTYSIDDYKVIDPINTGFWEVVRKLPVTFSSLYILNEEREENTVIFGSWESTYPYSINENRNKVFWRAALFAPRIMEGLYKYGDDYFTTLKNRFKSVSISKNSHLHSLSLLISARSIFDYCLIAAKGIYKKLLFTDAFSWKLLFDINDGHNLCSTNFSSYKYLSAPKEYFWADPFIVAQDNNYYVFVEELIYRKNRAHISVLELDCQGNLLSSERIIERPYHMSYPFVFKIDATYYMIPETCQNKTIELYKCIDFPHKWEFEKNIMENLSATDTTLFYYGNKWWLFTSLDQTDNNSGCSTELFLFYSDSVFSDDWKSHPGNPIVSDERAARPAGKIFIHEGKIFRPSQDCSVRYGKGFKLNIITKLTEYTYEEKVYCAKEPLWDKQLKGTHTFNFDNDFTIIDVYSFRKRIPIN